ncbi:uncharacterized protein BKA55DRAFT_544460 [Fusarium redolens]|uniref:Uncharacterized protein n=1 Tax=Fusarium redolens TaxID=48865 RepID=A0A9P9JUP0_FUSRE|nr:uncharacterized protein BKA55DRAFT_544460 [Fusarium redolens]KAH7233996.1 hypothetical protein BKA55DRAFT_544460 [Fusarium redolens]
MLDTYSGTGGVSREVPMAGSLPVLSIRSGIVPVGQTLGLARKRHSEPFNGSIGDLTQGRLIMIALAPGATPTLPRDNTRRWPAPLQQHRKGAPADDLVSLWDEVRDIDIARYFSLAGALHHSKQLAEIVTTIVEYFYHLDGGTESDCGSWQACKDSPCHTDSSEAPPRFIRNLAIDLA